VRDPRADDTALTDAAVEIVTVAFNLIAGGGAGAGNNNKLTCGAGHHIASASYALGQRQAASGAVCDGGDAVVSTDGMIGVHCHRGASSHASGGTIRATGAAGAADSAMLARGNQA
jgi:hypothetical protein